MVTDEDPNPPAGRRPRRKGRKRKPSTGLAEQREEAIKKLQQLDGGHKRRYHSASIQVERSGRAFFVVHGRTRPDKELTNRCKKPVTNDLQADKVDHYLKTLAVKEKAERREQLLELARKAKARRKTARDAGRDAHAVAIDFGAGSAVGFSTCFGSVELTDNIYLGQERYMELVVAQLQSRLQNAKNGGASDRFMKRLTKQLATARRKLNAHRLSLRNR